MGCCASQDGWNQISVQVVIDPQDWAAKIVDDILVWANSYKELYNRIRNVAKNAKISESQFPKRNCKLGQKCGIFSNQRGGVSSDPEKVQCIRDFPRPTDVTILRAYLGLANQLGAFVPVLRQSVVKMRSLLRTVYQ